MIRLPPHPTPHLLLLRGMCDRYDLVFRRGGGGEERPDTRFGSRVSCNIRAIGFILTVKIKDKCDYYVISRFVSNWDCQRLYIRFAVLDSLTLINKTVWHYVIGRCFALYLFRNSPHHPFSMYHQSPPNHLSNCVRWPQIQCHGRTFTHSTPL